MNIGVFADITNLHDNIKKRFPNQYLDYEKYLDSIESEYGKISRAICYGIKKIEGNNGFYTRLRSLGYDVKYKVRPVSSWTGELKKVSWDIGITLDVLNAIEVHKLDTVILGSSGSNLADLVIYMNSRGVKSIIHACGISQELKKAASNWIEIDESLLKEEFDETPVAT